MTNAAAMMAALVVLAGCLTEDQARAPALAPAAAPVPATCADALYNVVQAEKAYDEFLAGVDQVREAVLAANRLCGQ